MARFSQIIRMSQKLSPLNYIHFSLLLCLFFIIYIFLLFINYIVYIGEERKRERFILYILFLQFAGEIISRFYARKKNCAITVAGHRYFYRKRQVFVTFVLGGVRFS